MLELRKGWLSTEGLSFRRSLSSHECTAGLSICNASPPFYLREKGCGGCRPVQLTVSWMGVNILMNRQQGHNCSITGPHLRSSWKPQRQYNGKPFFAVEPNFPHRTYSTTVQKVFQHTRHFSLMMLPHTLLLPTSHKLLLPT